MLNRNKLIEQFESSVNKIFIGLEQEITFVKSCWQWLMNNSQQCKQLVESYGKLKCIELPYLSYKVKSIGNPYKVLAVDGSQIYPDRHQGISCFLLNIGKAEFTYQADKASAVFDSEPFIYTQQNHGLGTEVVDSLRMDLEFKKALEYSLAIKHEENNLPYAILTDGPLNFWQLQNEAEINKMLEPFFLNRFALAGFISSPKSRDLINLIKFGLEQKIIPINTDKPILFEYITDSDLLINFLRPMERSCLLLNKAIYFFYFNTGEEIARIEIQSFVAQDAYKFDQLIGIISDQCTKGRGYPVCLTEAHEAAVVKAADREFFYSILHKITQTNNQKYNFSQKSLKKRFPAI